MIRVTEYKADMRSNKPYSALSKLHQIQFVNVDFNNFKIIFRTNVHKEAIIKESIEIIANKDVSCLLHYNILFIEYGKINIYFNIYICYLI